MENMDDVFKFWYEVYVFSRSLLVEPDWKVQIQRLYEIWEEIGQLITLDCFRDNFINHCAELDLPGETYDLKEGYKMANNEWREELMITVSDRIIKHYDDDVSLSATVVSWDSVKNCIFVDKSICKLYYEKE